MRTFSDSSRPRPTTWKKSASSIRRRAAIIPPSTLQVTAIDRELHEASRKVDALEWERTTLDQQMNSSAERIAQLERKLAAQRSFLRKLANARRALQSDSRDSAFAR